MTENASTAQNSAGETSVPMPKNADYTREYFEIIDDLDGDIDGRRAVRAAMDASTAIYHGEVVETTFIPRLFNRRTYETMKHDAELMHRILCKVMQRYLDDPEYRDVFDFDPRLVELILLPRGYDSLLPFARVDTFLNEDDYRVQFCEFNADGSSGMNENRELTAAISQSETFKAFQEHHRTEACELFDPWVDKFLEIYRGYDHAIEHPTIAICDYLANGVVDEFKVFANLFEERGYHCKIVDVCDLTFDGETLLDGDLEPIHAIWRRCVTNDVIDHWSESQDLINAVRAEKVALIGSFAGHIVHDKQIFEVLLKPETCAFLDAEEIDFIEQAIPTTAFLTDEEVNIAQIRANKDEWLIKPADHYGADQVYAGCYVTQTEWETLIDRHANGASGYPFIVQRYVRPFKTETLPPDKQILDLPDGAISSIPVLYNNLNGLYLYDGHFQGVFSRLGPRPTISKDMEGVTAATIWVDRC